ncbi:MAG TPA: aminopeptidase [Steroidobacteraceae bacterium]|jgi:predicted aminopeptidase|nr:aminopeptidase [Steroidobacteraceae bacterium]
MLTESRKVLTVALLLAGSSILPGCGSLYLLQAARGQAQILVDRRPVAAVVADPKTPATVRDTLAEVSAARDFASHDLGLPDNRSYRVYADIGRPYVVWNVVAAPEFSIAPRQWCFPIAGCVTYRGYFRQKSAQGYAHQLAAQGYDTVVEGVPAYSTLGHFDDPILNTMLPYGRDQLAAIIFHELAHQLLYVANDSAFNEAFASTVEEEGLARWLTFKGRPGDIENFRRSAARAKQYSDLLAQARRDLAHLYATQLAPPQMRAAKQARLAALADAVRATEKRLGYPSGYGAWAAQGFNNAELASVATYEDCEPGFKRMLAQEQGDLPRFYAAVRALARKPAAQRDAQVCKAP